MEAINFRCDWFNPPELFGDFAFKPNGFGLGVAGVGGGNDLGGNCRAYVACTILKVKVASMTSSVTVSRVKVRYYMGTNRSISYNEWQMVKILTREA